ncbi:acyl-CoA carboxylase subunit beta [SAR92 clade bacterium H246]
MNTNVDDLHQRRQIALAQGGPEKIQRQHKRGKLTARERVNLLLDPDSFQEYGLLGTHHNQKPGEPITPADALVAGIGNIHGRPVALFAEDATVYGGSIGEVNGIKRNRMVELATREKIPLICLLDGAGFRAQSMLDAVEGSPSIGHILNYARQSGTAPTIGLIMGGCAGEPALNAALLEYAIMVKGNGMIAAGGPPVVKASTGLDISKEELGGTSVHAEITGMIDNVVEDDAEAITSVKRLLSYLPTNAWAYPPSTTPKKAKEGAKVLIGKILPEHPRRPYDMHEVIDCVVDQDSFFATKADYGKALITGLARLNGHPVGILANQPMVQAGALSAAAAQKARKFIDYCSAYHIPIISLTDTPGVMTGPQSEREGSLKYGLGAAYALAWADIPVFSVILRKAFGFGGALMAGSAGPQTVALAWPTADFSSLPPDSAIESAHKKELDEAEDREALYAELMKQYQTFGGPYPAAGIMNIDDVIAPEETRARLIQALETSMARRTEAPRPVLRAGVMP